MRRLQIGIFLLCLCNLAGCGDPSTAVTERAQGTPTVAAPVGGRLAIVPVRGRVQLPSALLSSNSNLRILNSLGSTPLGPDATYQAWNFQGGPQLAMLLNQQGNPVLLGFIDGEHPNLTCRTTAEVLVYFALMTPALPAQQQVQVRQRIAALGSELDPLVNLLNQGLAQDPDYFAHHGNEVRATLLQVIQKLLATPQPRVLIEPGTESSGIAVNNQGGINSVTLKNSYRRRAYAYVEHLKDILDNGTESPSRFTVSEFELAPTTGYQGVFGTIGGYFAKDIAYTPVQASPVELSVPGGVKYSQYQVVVVGPGQQAGGRFNELTPAQIERQRKVAGQYFFGDVAVPVLLNMVLPAWSEGLDYAIGEKDATSALGDYIAFMTGNVPALTQTANADFATIMREVWGAIEGTSLGKQKTAQLIALILTKAAGEEAGQVVVEKMEWLFKVVGWIDISGYVLDGGILAAHHNASQRADIWDIKATAPKVSLNPKTQEIPVYGNLDFDHRLIATTIDELGGGVPTGLAFAYHWSCPGQAGHLINPQNPTDTSNDFQTSSEFVQYVADLGVAETETIRCEVFVKQGTELRSVGVNTASIVVKRPTLQISPMTPQVAPGTSQAFQVTVDPPLTAGQPLLYHWSCNNQFGELSNSGGQRAPFDELTGQASYQAGSQSGTENIAVELIRTWDDGSRHSVANTTTTVQVKSSELTLTGPTRILANGAEIRSCTATLVDPQGNPVVGAQLHFDATVGSLVDNRQWPNAANGYLGVASTDLSTDANGQATVYVFSHNSVGNGTLTASSAGKQDVLKIEFFSQIDSARFLVLMGDNFNSPPTTIEVGYVVWPQVPNALSYDVYCNANGQPDPYASYWDQNAWNSNNNHFAFRVGAQPNWLNGPTLPGMMAAPIPATFGPDPGVVEWYYGRFGAYTWSVTPRY